MDLTNISLGIDIATASSVIVAAVSFIVKNAKNQRVDYANDVIQEVLDRKDKLGELYVDIGMLLSFNWDTLKESEQEMRMEKVKSLLYEMNREGNSFSKYIDTNLLFKVHNIKCDQKKAEALLKEISTRINKYITNFVVAGPDGKKLKEVTDSYEKDVAAKLLELNKLIM